jgi:leader peptidase (prepilin peptidase)/N-methyltransferase
VAAVPEVALAAVAGALGLPAGFLINRAAGGFPWPVQKRPWRRGSDAASRDGVPAPQFHDRGGAVRPPLVEVGTAALFVLVAVRFGLSPELPAFLCLAGAGVLLAVIDVRHRLLPDRVVLPSLGIGALMLAGAALVHGNWTALARAAAAALLLFLVFLVLALIAPSGLGMGDVKLAALLGLYLGWLGWGAVVVGAAAGFVVQALLALLLLAARRIGLRGELPFGPAMLLGAVLVIGWTGALVGSAALLP